MLGLRLDEPLVLGGALAGAVDLESLDRLERLGLAVGDTARSTLALTERGRFLGGAVTAELLAADA
jgi:hypothetical protein